MRLADGAGIAFYDFAPEVDPTTVKRRFRAALDALPVDASAAGEIVAEAGVAFALHVSLFDELDEARAKR
jgi:heme oxygenase